MIVRMSKVRILGPKKLQRRTIELLHKTGLFHMDSSPESIDRCDDFIKSSIVPDDERAERTNLESILERLKNLKLLLPSVEATYDKCSISPDVRSREFLSALAKTESMMRNHQKKKSELVEESSVVSRFSDILTALAPVLANFNSFPGLEALGLTIEKEREDIIPLLREQLEILTGGAYGLFTTDVNASITGIIVTFPHMKSAKVRSLLSDESIHEIKLPEEYSDKPLSETIKILIRRAAEIPEEIKKTDLEIQQLASDWYNYCNLPVCISMIKDRLAEISALSRSAETEFTFMFTGWLPSEKLPEFRSVAKEATGRALIIQELRISPDELEEVPVMLENRGIVKPFKLLMEILPLPRYGTVDPTPLMALFFPIFFGIILGDIGYGLIVLALSIYLFKRYSDNEDLRHAAAIFAISSVSSVFFGILFGELFGTFGEEHLGLHPILFDRGKALIPFLIMAVSIGVFHILVGISLGLMISVRKRDKKEIIARAATILMLFSSITLLASSMGFVPMTLFNPTLIMTAFLVIVLIISEGFIGPLEFIQTIGNIVSYARLMAIGVSSVILANVGNELGGMAGNMVGGLLIAITIHGINLILGIFSPTIHSLRLHYVEFFGKFFESGGRKFEPFRRESLV